MTENQTRLFTLNETGSAENCPVSISGGYLYKDDTSNSIKACLQISNKSGKELKSLRFRLHPIDKDGKLLAFDEELDRNGPFKADEPIELEDIMVPFITASFKAELVKAETADGSILDLQGMPAVKEQSEQKSEDNTESSSGEKTPEKSVQEQNSDDAKEVRTGNDDAKPASAEKEEMSSGEVTVNTVQQAKQEVKPSRRSVFKKLIVILIPAILILSGLAIIFIGAYLPERRYLKAVDLFNTGDADLRIAYRHIECVSRDRHNTSAERRIHKIPSTVSSEKYSRCRPIHAFSNKPYAIVILTSCYIVFYRSLFYLIPVKSSIRIICRYIKIILPLILGSDLLFSSFTSVLP